MKKAILVPLLALVGLSTVQAGPLFDDYLNYVRPGTGTGPGTAAVEVTQAQSAGQSFTVPSNTGEVYRIGIRPVYDTWTTDEKVTMALYDSPEKKQKLGEYSIGQATSVVADYVIGNGSDFSHTDDRILYFQFRKPVDGKNQLYFELSVSGGDAKVSFKAFDTDAYAEGRAYPDGTVKDISFDCHIKPVADKEANLRKFFTERLDISRPELAAVKAAVDSGDWEKAIAETVKHFHNRADLWQAWKDVMEVKVDPDADTGSADLLLRDMALNAETGQPVQWRRESYWVPNYPGKQPNHTMKPSPYLWHIDRALAGAYTATGKAEYARKCIDLRMQWILDNPNPKVVYSGQEKFPWYFEQWSDRTSGARTPGHGDLVYARLYNYTGWTDDEKLVLFSFFEDNARWTYKATSGANWGAEAARASLDFGIRFPEWKMSREYSMWGASRLAEIILEDVRKDGTSTEAAIKYHAMVARRLKGMIEDCRAGRVALEPDIYKQAEKIFEAMYEHMAYALQPNSYVVMCGDSWYENYTEELADAGKMLDRQDFIWIATQGKQGQPPKEISKVFPGGGYYIMRSDFGGPGIDYTDSRQLFVHNGGWFGSHGHWDLLSINLYAYGRPLIIDPGQYGQTLPEGVNNQNWESNIHSMLVMNGRNVSREPGPAEWVSNSVIDWMDGKHYGYNRVDYTRRRIAFMKPDYYLIDDSVKPSYQADWIQVWNLTDPNAKADPSTKAVETTFNDGGNVLILNQNPEDITVEEAKGTTSSGDAFPNTKIIRLHRNTDNPRFRTLVYPYKAGARPDLNWEVMDADNNSDNLAYSLKIKASTFQDWTVFGDCGKPASYRSGKHKVDADFLAVRMNGRGRVQSFSWADGREFIFNGKTIARSDQRVHGLAVKYAGSKLHVEAKEPESTLMLWAWNAKTIVLNGKTVTNPVIVKGMYHPFAGEPRTIVADERDGFEKITGGTEWARIADPASWATGYLHHETDLGRHENGNYIFDVPRSGKYGIELHLPKMTIVPSDRVEYRIEAPGTPAQKGGPIIDVRHEGSACIFTINQQTMAGWIKLGDFDLKQGQFKINSKNVTRIDGIYFTADAMRLVESRK